VSKLEALDVCVVGITDYFTIQGYKKVKEFKNGGRLSKVHTILPNIEFRLKSIVSNRRDKEEIRLNLHVIFSDEVQEKDIEEHFLHDITFYYQGDPQNPDQKRKLKLSNLEELGKDLLKQHEKFRKMNLQPGELGAMQAVVDHEEITKLLTGDSRFKNKYIVVLPATGWDEINWDGQAHLVRKGLLQKSDMVLSGNPNTRLWCLGAGPYKEGEEKFKEEFSTLKPCVHGSDAHKLSEIGNPCRLRGEQGHNCEDNGEQCEPRFCWIKADPTFEGLKQLLYESSDRVSIQELDPTPLKSNSCLGGFRIDGVRINEELSLAATNLPFNTGLVAVTGGKGAGKTALVDLIANLFVDRCNSKDPNSFVRRILNDKANLNVTITLGDGTLFEKALNDSRFVEQSEVVYIAQGELEDYIGENSDLDKYVRDLIFESPEVKNTVKTFEFEKLAKRVHEIEREIGQRNQQVELLEKRTSEKVLAAAKRDKTQIEAESRDVEAKIPALELRLTKEKVEVVTQKQTNRSTLQDRKSRLIELGEILSSAKQFISEDVSRFNLSTSRINGLLKELHIDGVVPPIEYGASGELDEIAGKMEKELHAVVTAIEASEKELHSYEAEMQEHARVLSRKKELSIGLDEVNKKLDTIGLDTKLLEKNRTERNGCFAELLRTVLQQQHKYTEIIEVFGQQKDEVLSDLDFKANVHFARATILTGLQEILDNRQVEVFGTEESPSQFQALQDLYAQVSSGQSAAVETLVEETSRLCEEMKEKMKKSQAISVGNLYKCLYGMYLAVVPIVTYKKTALSKLSLGQKATVLIKIYLAQGKNPIIIDSHDDHLDNEFIMDELVGAIRKAKTYRQVILASNNGNVVINSDAEQIVIAHRKDGEISYVSGAIENPVIRDRALKVLEGGADAFRKRQEKYRIES
jgi:ABC-type cobalamin/Fe3+-siderophores transport system ATPase subunit